jgi:uncharacterized membrane protein (UPF0127 family)
MNKLFGPKHKIIAEHIIYADSFGQRLIGLIPKKDFPANSAFWISRCNSVHTLFMSYPIDCIFLNKQMQIVQIITNLKPWRITGIYFSATSVIEMRSTMASIEKLNKLTLGDQLYVGS